MRNSNQVIHRNGPSHSGRNSHPISRIFPRVVRIKVQKEMYLEHLSAPFRGFQTKSSVLAKNTYENKNEPKAIKSPDLLVRQVEEMLTSNKIPYRVLEHPPEGNCEKVSVLRGTPLHAAAKALLLNVKMKQRVEKAVLAILPGNRKVDFQKIVMQFDARSVEMAQSKKVEELLECEVGRVPPFSFNSEVKVIVDKPLVEENNKIYFSPGRLDRSREIDATHYKELIIKARGELFHFSQPLTKTKPLNSHASSEVNHSEKNNTNAEVSESHISLISSNRKSK